MIPRDSAKGKSNAERPSCSRDESISILKEHELTTHSGCACKLAANYLPIVCGNALPTYAEDCGVIQFGEKLLLSTVDFGPCVGKDLVAAGKIAALNSLSDVYACGGQPLAADVVLIIDEGWTPERAAFVQQGIRAACQEDDVRITGGHTVIGSETMVGLAVTGIVDVDKFKGKRTGQTGDTLMISKPLGVGLVVRAFVAGIVDDEALAEAIDVMKTSNRKASYAANAAGVTAMTDVTGFGLLGHLSEMLINTGLGAIINLASVPTLPSIAGLPKTSLRSKFLEENLRYVREQISLIGIRDFYRLAPLIDPQTSGGLLVSASTNAAAELTATGYFTAIGKFDGEQRIEVVG